MKRERDPFLDRLRTLAIVWVLMVHLFYWLNFFPTGTLALVKSWLLLVMIKMARFIQNRSRVPLTTI